MGICKLNTAGPRSTFDRLFPALRLLSIVVVTSEEYIAPDFKGVDGNVAAIKGKISWLTRNQNKNFLSPCTYLFSCLLAWGSLILATSLLQFCWRIASAAEFQVFIPWKRMFSFRGFVFPSPFPCPPLPGSLQNTSVGRNSWTERGYNEPGKEATVMKTSTCRYSTKERKVSSSRSDLLLEGGKGSVQPWAACRSQAEALCGARVSGISQLCFGCF